MQLFCTNQDEAEGVLSTRNVSVSNIEWAEKTVVVIDAGHGGRDPGAVGKKAREKDINLNVALKLGSLIEKNCPQTRVIYTRKKDVFVSLEKRANIANNAKADLFISIHTNALPKGKIARGTNFTRRNRRNKSCV